ncbi:DoxX family protein [Nocardia sp. NPDC049190]|uniref:DoxX family protein n=1 Tax=Nocardia sp. NPDC049190 TaxID=3155650 RepID=UPI0033E53EBE
MPPKLADQSAAVRIFDEIGFGDWFHCFTGVVEIPGGIGPLVPRVSGLTGAGLSTVMVLAAATQAFVLGAPGLASFPLVLAMLLVWMASRRRDTIVAVSQLLSR